MVISLVVFSLIKHVRQERSDMPVCSDNECLPVINWPLNTSMPFHRPGLWFAVMMRCISRWTMCESWYHSQEVMRRNNLMYPASVMAKSLTQPEGHFYRFHKAGKREAGDRRNRQQ